MSNKESDDADDVGSIGFATRLESLYSNIVTQRRFEPLLSYILFDKASGQWLDLRTCDIDELPEEVVVTWLPLPGPDESKFVLVILMHLESGWVWTAFCNAAWHLARRDSAEPQDPKIPKGTFKIPPRRTL